MTDSESSASSPRSDQPGKNRTMWHPLLARLLDFSLGSAFSVQEEISVGKLPLQVDILLIRREGERLSDIGRRELSELVPLVNRFTLIEFKAPADALERGDFARLVGCSYLWHGQQEEPIPYSEISLMILATRANRALLEELRLLHCETSEHGPGVFQVTGLPFTAWMVETDVMAEHGQPVLSLVSRVFLDDRKRIIEVPCNTGIPRTLKNCKRNSSRRCWRRPLQSSVCAGCRRRIACAGCCRRSVCADCLRRTSPLA
jgi:hypothetical protein